MKKIIIVLAFLLLNISINFAQPHFNDEQGGLNYRNYELLINPASLGGTQHYQLSLGLNKQWTGVENSPLSEILQYQMAIGQNNAFGAWVYNESYGAQNNTQFAAAYAYKINIKSGTLSLGVNMSLLLMNEKAVSNINNPNDPLFTGAAGSQLGFNAGFGAYYFSDKFYAGFSIPQLLTNDLTTGTPGTKLENKLDFGRMQYYFTGAYRFDAGEKISLQPSALLELSGATDLGYEVMLTAAYLRRFEVGAGWAAHSRVQIAAGFALGKMFHIRYQYSQNLGNDYKYTGGSHFVTLKFVL